MTTITQDKAIYILSNIDFICTKEDNLEDAHIALSTHMERDGLNSALEHIGKVFSTSTYILQQGGGDGTRISLDPVSDFLFSTNNVLDEVMEQLDFIVLSASNFEVKAPRKPALFIKNVMCNEWKIEGILTGSEAQELGKAIVQMIQLNVDIFNDYETMS